MTKRKLLKRRSKPPTLDLAQLKVELVDINSVQPHPKNSRHHSEKNIQAIMSSLTEHGQRSLIVANHKGQIVKGNGTWESAVRLGWKKIQVTFHKFRNEAQEIAYMIADNKTNDLSEFNFTHLASNLHELKAANYDLTKTGFAEFEINPLIAADVWDPNSIKAEEPVEEAEVVPEWTDHKAIRKAVRMFNSFRGKDLPVEEALIGICRDYIAYSEER